MTHALPLLVPILLASVGDCYLVTNTRSEAIPCNFSASVTDALRYHAKEED